MLAFLDHNSLFTPEENYVDQLCKRIDNFITHIYKLAKIRGYSKFLKISDFETFLINPTYSIKSILQKMDGDNRQGEAYDRFTFFLSILNSSDKWDDLLRKRYSDYICYDINGDDCSKTVFACAAYCGGLVIGWLSDPSSCEQVLTFKVAQNRYDVKHEVAVERIITDNQIGRFYRIGRHKFGDHVVLDTELGKRKNRSSGSDFDLGEENAQYVLNLGIIINNRMPENARLISAVYRGEEYCFPYDHNEDHTRAIISYSEHTNRFYEFRYDNVDSYHGYNITPNWKPHQKRKYKELILSNNRIVK